MKSIFFTQFIIFSLFFFVGCSSQNQISQNKSPEFQAEKITQNQSKIISISDFFEDENSKNETHYADFNYVNLHFSETPSVELRAELSEKGILFNNYLGNSSYSVAIPSNLEISTLQNDLILGVSISDNAQKISPQLASKIQSNSTKNITVNLNYQKNISDRPILLELAKKGINVNSNNPFFNHIQVEANAQQIQDLTQENWLVRAENELIAKPLGHIESDFIRSSYLQTQKGLTGKNIRVGIWDEGNINPDHPELFGHSEIVENVGVLYHPMTVAGILGSSGIINPAYRGCAPEAMLYSWDYNDSHLEILQAIQNQDIMIGNHSYGYAPDANGYLYGSLDKLTDQSIENYPYLVSVFAVGNAGASGYKSTQSASKNTIMVGATGIQDALGAPSSKGPTRDGRLKPDVVSAGFRVETLSQTDYTATTTWGTSQSAPAISGLVAQLYQFYTENYSSRPPASLMKAVINNTARDIGNKYPDFHAGYGRADGMRALKTLEENRFKIEEVSHGNTKKMTIEVPANTAELKIMLCWTDPTGNLYNDATSVLVNNLDISLEQLSNNTITQPWILDPANPANLATRGTDNLNNVEQITLENPEAGTYEITVFGTNIPVGATQEYTLTWQMEEKHLQVIYLAQDDVVLPNQPIDIYWSKAGVSGDQTLEYSIDDGANWLPIAGILPENDVFYYQWVTPDVVTNQARIRVNADGISTISDRFTIFQTPTNLTLNPSDNQMGISWNEVDNATHYDVFQLDKNNNEWIEIASNITTLFHTATGLEGGKSYTFTVKAKSNTLNISSEQAIAKSATPTSGVSGDLTILEIKNPTVSNFDFIRPNATEFITVRLKNKGNVTIPTGTSLTAKFWVNNVEISSETFTTADILAGNEFDFGFAVSADFSEEKIYKLRSQIIWIFDPVSDNNSLSKNIDGQSVIKITADSPETFCTASVRLQIEGITTDYTASSITPALEDMTGGTAVSLINFEFSDAIPINFQFPFYGQWYDKFYISDNGLITFNSYVSEKTEDSGEITNSAFLDNFIAGVWSDLYPNYGAIKYKNFDVSPNQKMVIEFNDVPYVHTSSPYTGYSSERVTFQIHIYESGIIELHYQEVDKNTWATSSAPGSYDYTRMTAGIESQDDTKGTALTGKNYSDWEITTPEAHRFTPNFPVWSNSDVGFYTNISNSGNYSVNLTQNGKTKTLSKTLTKVCGTAPIITSFSPSDDEINVLNSTDLELIFDENIQAGTGNITLSNGTDIRTFPIEGNSGITTEIENNLLKIKLLNPLQGGTNYHVLIDNGAIQDNENTPNNFAGITNTTTWNFSTKNDAPSNLFLSAVSVDNNLSDGSPIGKLTAFDLNSHQTHNFTISGGTGASFFQTQNDELLTKGTLVFSSVYTLEITATDDGNPVKSYAKMFEVSMNFVTVLETPNNSESSDNSSKPNFLKDQEITFDELAFISFGKRFTLNPQTEFGGKITYTILNGEARISGDYIYPNQVGTLQILMTQAGGNGYKKTETTHTLEVVKGEQVLSESQINPISDKVWTIQEFTPNFGINNLQFEITEGNEFATISEGKIQLQKTGKVRLKIYLAETENYLSSNVIFREFEILKTEQNISFNRIQTQTFGNPDFEIYAESSSGLEIVFNEESDFIELENNLVKIKGAGEVEITVSQAGNEFYFPAETSQTFKIKKAKQSIEFDAISDKKITDNSFEIFAKSSADLHISFAIFPEELAEIIEGEVYIKNAGKVKIIASQSGNENYEKATEVFQTFEILPEFQISNIQVIDGNKLQISIEEYGGFINSNSLKIYLSDENGSFDNQRILYARKNADGIWIAQLPENITESSNYQIKIQTNNPKIEAQILEVSETLFPEPKTFFITQKENQICASGEADSYVWFLNDEVLEGNTEQCLDLNNFKSDSKLIFKVQGKNGSRKGEISTAFGTKFVQITALENSDKLNSNILIYPNPNDGKFTVDLKGNYTQIKLQIVDISGRILVSKSYENQSNLKQKIDLKNQSAGVYFLEIQTEKGKVSRKIILE